MESIIVYEKSDKDIETLPIDNKNQILKNSIIMGTGSESSLNSIHSQQQEIVHSSTSSINPIGKSINSINNSNDINAINVFNTPNSSFNNIVNQSDLTNLKTSNNSNISDSMDIIFDASNNIKNSIKEYSIISNNNIIDKQYIINSNKNNYETKLEKIDNNKKINHSNKEKHSKNESENDLIKSNVKKKMKKGYIPFFVKAKGYNVVFYYGEPNSKLDNIIEHYIKKVNGTNEIKNSFYYNKKPIDLESTIGQIKIERFGIITNEIN